MHILNRIFNRHPEVGGELGYYGLGSWWTSTFSPRERQYLEGTVQSPSLPAGTRPLTRDRGLLPVQTTAGLLILLADRLTERPGDRSLAHRVLAKAEERAVAESDLLGLHFTYHQMIRLHLRWKEHFLDASDLAFAACHKQMRLAPQVAGVYRQKYPEEPLPIHLGYVHAVKLLEQQGALPRAIEICKQAQAEGWAGNWPWRIQRMARRLHEESFTVKPISSSGIGPI